MVHSAAATAAPLLGACKWLGLGMLAAWTVEGQPLHRAMMQSLNTCPTCVCFSWRLVKSLCQGEQVILSHYGLSHTCFIMCSCINSGLRSFCLRES